MKPSDLIVRCYAEKVGDQWQAFCLDFGLAAQADTSAEVRAKLDAMIKEYIHDALVGEDKEYAFELLTQRTAPMKYWMKFYMYVFLYRIGALKKGVRMLFCPPLPMEPSNYRHA